MPHKTSPSICVISQESFSNTINEEWGLGAALNAVRRAAKKGYGSVWTRPIPGIEMKVAEQVVKNKEPALRLAHPYQGFGKLWKPWPKADLERLNRLRDEADEVIYTDAALFAEGRRQVLDQGVHSWGKWSECSEWMIENTDASIIIVEQGSHDPASYMLSYATLILETPVYFIDPSTKSAEWIMPKQREEDNANPANQGSEK